MAGSTGGGIAGAGVAVSTLLRCTYALLLLAGLCVVYADRFPGRDLWSLTSGPRLTGAVSLHINQGHGPPAYLGFAVEAEPGRQGQRRETATKHLEQNLELAVKPGKRPLVPPLLVHPAQSGSAS